MKNLVCKIILFFTIVLIIDIFVGIVCNSLHTSSKGGLSKGLNDLLNKDVYDIIVFGSSRAHHHYDTPMISDSLGLDVYNAGYDGNGIILAYGLLNLISERYLPSMIIYDVEPTFDINIYQNDKKYTRYINFLKPYYNDKAISEIIKDISLTEYILLHSSLYRYNTSAISLLIDNLITRKTDIYGYEPLYGSMCSTSRTVVDDSVEVDFFKLKYLSKLIEFCQVNNIPLVFTASPHYDVLDSEIFEPAVDLCRKYNVPFLNYYDSEYFRTNISYFKDPMHLNAKGAREFSKLFVSDILPIIEQQNIRPIIRNY